MLGSFTGKTETEPKPSTGALEYARSDERKKGSSVRRGAVPASCISAIMLSATRIRKNGGKKGYPKEKKDASEK